MKNLVIYSSFLIFLGACSSPVIQKEPSSTASDLNVVSLNAVQQENSAITLGRFESRPLSQTLNVNGKIELPPQGLVSISVSVGGHVKSTNLVPGMAVRKGQVLAELEDFEYISLQEDYLSLVEKLRYSEKERNRQRELNQSKASSDKVLEQIELSYQSQKIALRALEEKLNLLHLDLSGLSKGEIQSSIVLRSPINGYVSKVNVNRGKHVDPSEVLFELIDVSDLKLSVKVFEKDLSKLHVGQDLIAYSNSNPSQTYTSQILFIGKDISEDGSIDVHCKINGDEKLFPGMYMNALIKVEKQTVAALPQDAVLLYEGKHHIFLAKGNGQFELRTVETGRTENAFVEVLNAENLAEQDIVLGGAYALLMTLKNSDQE